MKKSTRTIRSKILTLAILLAGSMTLLTGCNEEEVPDVTAGRPVMRILFVGNDFTFMNNMPYMVQAFAQSDPTAYFKIELEMHVAQSASLSQLWNNPLTKDFLTMSKWDYVIIQPHHMWASSDGSVYLTRKAISVWSSQVKALGAQPVFFMTWPLEATHSSYTDPNLKLKNYKNMHRLNRGYSNALSDKYEMLLAPIGDYWMKTISEKPDINLYNADRYAPSLEGSYLTALILYKKLVDGTLDDIGYIPDEMSPEVKDELVAIASQKIK